MKLILKKKKKMVKNILFSILLLTSCYSPSQVLDNPQPLRAPATAAAQPLVELEATWEAPVLLAQLRDNLEVYRLFKFQNRQQYIDWRIDEKMTYIIVRIVPQDVGQ